MGSQMLTCTAIITYAFIIGTGFVQSETTNAATPPVNLTSVDFPTVVPSGDADLRHYSIKASAPVAFIDSQSAFENLTLSEKLYTHYFSRASWYGGLIDLFQTSVESPYIFLLLQQIFRTDNVEDYATKKCEFSTADWDAFLKYTAGFYTNLGNYESYGMKKFIPLVSQTKLECLVQILSMSSPEGARGNLSLTSLWNYSSKLMYDLDERYLQQALKPTGITTYFSPNCDENDADIVRDYMTAKHIEGWNNRVIKIVLEDGRNLYEIRFASVVTDNGGLDGIALGQMENYKNNSFLLMRGDFSELLAHVNQELSQAKNYVSNDIEKNILVSLMESFSTGSINAHKKASQFWVQNKMPTLESYIGFIETYQDPSGQRASFEGFVAVVDKAKTARLANLVAHAESFLTFLPWPKQFEKDQFLRPDFTDLTIVTFASGSVPAGINLPNYNEIRQVDGFKNVNLGNVISATYASKKIQYLTADDASAVKQNVMLVFDIIVGLHELLGHGSGKLFMASADGSLNFNPLFIGNVEPYGPVDTWYKPGQTYESLFGKLASTMEECRAESVATYLSLYPEVLSIWGLNETESEWIAYLLWLQEASSGLVALAEYKPGTDTWGEAHAQGHFAILRVMQESGVAHINIVTAMDGKPDLLVTLDRDKIRTNGKAAMGQFLLGLEFYRSTGNVTGAQALYNRYTTMKGADRDILMQWQKIAVDRKEPRALIIMPNTVREKQGLDETVVLKNYDANPDGMVQSFRDRFTDLTLEEEIFNMANRDRQRYLVT